jgi:cysteine-rich repeat protein
VPDVRRLLEHQFRSIPLDRFCNGTLDPLPLCGNGQEDPGEVCDGGDLGDLTCESLGQGSGTLACSPDCQGLVFAGCSGPPFCGNGIKDAGEACDTSGSSATCDYDCTAPACGDDVANKHTLPIAEECDDGNLQDRDNCNSRCQVPWCGNGRVDGPREACDDGNLENGDGCSAACRREEP